jgi:hypothetical protein
MMRSGHGPRGDHSGTISSQEAALNWLDLVSRAQVQEAWHQCTADYRRRIVDQVWGPELDLELAETLVGGWPRLATEWLSSLSQTLRGHDPERWGVLSGTRAVGANLEHVIVAPLDTLIVEGEPVPNCIILQMHLGPDGWLVDALERKRDE